jgi:molecular chaperone GrpE
MLQRTIFRQRSAWSAPTLLSPRVTSASLRSLGHLSRSQLYASPLRQSTFRIAPRLYSTETPTNSNEAKKDASETATNEETKPAAESQEEPVKRELEAKNKEIIDLKVIHSISRPFYSFIFPKLLLLLLSSPNIHLWLAFYDDC